ncbi:ATP-binding protein [uncultured Kordia sp.]|uniref:tetratricopeptide repeat-containing sensor histidine kinase n=1 Tax=uncultured Kordia sp. TaxID=507699 RepID=UPI002631CE74|nr:ATP-binding protein [uncultured Kordia sp.]
MTKSNLVLLIFFLVRHVAFSQNITIDSLLKKDNFQEAALEIQKMNRNDSDNSQFLYYSGKLARVKKNYIKALHFLEKVDSTKITDEIKPYFFNELGDTYRFLNLEEKAFKLKIKAQELFKKQGKASESNEINYDIHYLLSSQNFLEYNGNLYLDKYFKNAKLLGNNQQLLKVNLTIGAFNSKESEKDSYFKKAREYVSKIESPSSYYRYYNYLSLFARSNDHRLKYCDSALLYAQKLKSPEKMESTYKNYAVTYRSMKNYDISISFLLKADSLPIKSHFYNRKRILYEYLSKDYESVGDIDNAYKYLKLKVQYDNRFNTVDQNFKLISQATIYIEEQNILLREEKLIQKILLIVSFIIIILISVITYFINRNLKRKKLLVEKEEALKAARIETILKEQEIQNIDARHEGREKERKRIAEDLHDDLCSLLSTIKLYFQNMKVRKTQLQVEEDKLMKKANELLDEAYQKVRNIAHVKDASSNISDGLVVAITNFAKKVSESENLIVEVLHHGMNQPLEPETEKDLRRITTELITNAMNHAKATEIEIDINCDEEILSIVVEDNGIGFDPSKIDTTKKLGLYGIQKKVEVMKGKITIDSSAKSGTTVIIEIPMKP